jgi:hypothetical protein
MAHLLVIFLEFFGNVLLGILNHRLGPVKLTGSLPVVHAVVLLPVIIYDPNCIPIGLGAVGHETLEVGIDNAIPLHNNIEILPENDLGLRVFGLHVTACNGHDTTIRGVIYVACHCGPLFYPFDMVEHHPGILQIFTGLHTLDQVYPTTRPDF